MGISSGITETLRWIWEVQEPGKFPRQLLWVFKIKQFHCVTFKSTEYKYMLHVVSVIFKDFLVVNIDSELGTF